MMYKYETHLHTMPVSRCAQVSVRENLEFYKSKGYDGVFITNHFLDGNVNINTPMTYEEKLDFYFSDYEEALKMAPEIGIRVFLGVELSYGGTDFLIFGFDKAWYKAHPEIMEMPKRAELEMMMREGALVIQAHPYREAGYIDHIRLYPRSVEGVEVINACRTEGENGMAEAYAEHYGLLKTAGSDNHIGKRLPVLAGMESEEPIHSEEEFIAFVRAGKFRIFSEENKQN